MAKPNADGAEAGASSNGVEEVQPIASEGEAYDDSSPDSVSAPVDSSLGQPASGVDLDVGVTLDADHAPSGDGGLALESEGIEDDALNPDQSIDGDGQNVADPSELAAAHRADLADGTYALRVSNSSSAVLDVQGASGSPGAYVNLWARRSTGDNQLWVVSHDEGGLVTLTNAASGLVLGAEAGGAGSRIVQQADEGLPTQRWVAVKSGSSYRIVSAADPSLVLNARRGSTANGTWCELYADNGTPNQRWVLERTEPLRERLDALAAANASALPDGTYALRPAHASSLCLDVQGGSASSGASVNLWSFGGRSNQVWRVSHDSEGYVTLTNLSSGKALDSSGSNIRQRDLDPSSRSQKWVAVRSGSSYRFVPATDDALSLDVRRAGKTNGAQTIVYADSEAPNQRWALSAVSADRAALNDLAHGHAGELADGTYYVRVSNSSSAVLDVQGASRANSAFVNLWSKKGAPNQAWRVTHDSYGYVTLTNVASGKALDVRGADASSGARVIQYSSNGGWNQKWIAVKSGSSYKLVSAMSQSLVLDARRGSTANGTWTELYPDNGTANQRWAFERYDTAQLAMVNKAQGYSSRTKWLLLVNTRTNYVGIFTGSRGRWTLSKYWRCSSGASATPTVIGQFTVGAKGYSFGSGYTCYYWTQFYGDYLFHSIKYYQGTRKVLDGRLGMNISHGCVRLPISQAKWIYNNIPSGTKVVTYR